MKNLTQALMIWMAAFMLFAGMPAHAEDVAAPKADASFPDAQWDQNSLDALEKGSPYLANAEITLPPPPAKDSAEEKADIDALLKAQSERTPDAIAAAKAEENVDSIVIADAKLTPKVQLAVSQALDTINYFSLKAKKQYNRARPTQAVPGLTAIMAVPGNASYPSGHAAKGYMAALVLSAIDPDNKGKYMQRGIAAGEHRVIAGLHYPSDVTAGVELAKIVFAQLMEDPDYLKIFNEAQAEFKSTDKASTN